MVGRFSEAALAYELDVMEDTWTHPGLNNVFNFYSELEEVEEPGVLMRVGLGKTYFDNSIGLALYHRDADTFDRFRRLYNLGRNPSPKKKRMVAGPFSTTRSYIAENGRPRLPMGWMRLHLEK